MIALQIFSANNSLDMLLKKSTLIHRDRPSLNNQASSVPLSLFNATTVVYISAINVLNFSVYPVTANVFGAEQKKPTNNAKCIWHTLPHDMHLESTAGQFQRTDCSASAIVSALIWHFPTGECRPKS